MYAVLKISGRQYRVSAGDSFEVEKLDGALASTLDLTEVLMIGGEKTLIGAPTVSGAKVTCVIESQFRGTKILVFKKKRRNNYKNTRGHRSELTRLFVSEISSPLGTVSAENKPLIHDPNREKRVVEKKAKTTDEGGTEVKKKMSAKGGGSSKTKAKAAKKKTGAKKTTGGTKTKTKSKK